MLSASFIVMMFSKSKQLDRRVGGGSLLRFVDEPKFDPDRAIHIRSVNVWISLP